jgi:protocatechuate 3,4-dioxygenase beta subunit
MKTNRFTLLVSLIIIVVISVGCGSAEATPSAADIQTAIAETLTAAPTQTNTPTPETEITPEPSPTQASPTPTTIPVRPVDAVVDVAFLNLREGPSTLFDRVETYEEGTNVVAVARVDDSSWVEVEIEAEDGTVTGWMFTEYLDFYGSVSQLNLARLPAAQTISGFVLDENSDPIEDVVIVVVYSDDDGDLLTNATTDQLGSFSSYIPDDMFGILSVEVISPLCGSMLVDESCQVSSHILLNNQVFVSVPQESQEIIFIYETATYTLTGTVEDNNGQPVEDINITAQRDDGALSYGYSDINGEFSLPISAGIWEIFAVEFNPRNEGDRLTITIADTLPDPITLSAPD